MKQRRYIFLTDVTVTVVIFFLLSYLSTFLPNYLMFIEDNII